MALDYEKLENDFDCACNDVVKSLSEQYKTNYAASGAGKLTLFFDLIQKEFEEARLRFINEHNIGTDARAMKFVNAIAKSYAKKCLDEYSKV